MYVLTIVFLTSHVAIVSLHTNAEVCEALAVRARSYVEGPQAVASARCALKVTDGRAGPH